MIRFFLVLALIVVLIVVMALFFVSGREDDRLEEDFEKFLKEKDDLGDNLW